MAEYDKAIPPGGEGRISVKTNTTNQSGRMVKRTTLHTNDPEQRRATLTVVATIRQLIEVEPGIATLLGKKGEIKNIEVSIKGSKDRPLELTFHSFELDDVAQYFIETVEEGRLYNVTIQNLPDASGILRGYLRFRTNYSEKPEVSIFIRGRFVSN